MKKVVLVLSVLSLLVGSILLTGGNEYGIVGLFFGMVGLSFVDKSIVLGE
jgi:hypothetical protein